MLHLLPQCSWVGWCILQLSGPIDIMVSHDWPRGVYHYGNVANLLRMKPFFTYAMIGFCVVN